MKKLKRIDLLNIKFLITLMLLLGGIVFAETNKTTICPKPRNVIFPSGGKYVFPDTVNVNYENQQCQDPARLLATEASLYLSSEFKIDKSKTADIELVIEDNSYGPQSYNLIINNTAVVIKAPDKAGLFNGVVSLLWLIRDTATTSKQGKSVSLEAMDITDWPDIKQRGMDLQLYGFKPDMNFLRDTVKTLAMLKYNFVTFELAKKLSIEKYKDRFDEDAITREQFRELVEYCYSWGMDVLPKLNALGHLSRGGPWFEILGGQSGGMDLGCEENYQMLFDIVDAYLEDCPKSKYFHFGMDEASKCLKENSKKYNKEPYVLFNEHVDKVVEFCHKRQITPIVYHDLLLGPNEDIYWREGLANGGKTDSYLARKEMSRDVIINYWNYEGFERYRTVENFQKEGFKIWLTPWAGDCVRTMAQNASLLDATLYASTWVNGTYEDILVGQDAQARRAKQNGMLYTFRWMWDAFANVSTYSWNNHAFVNQSFDPGFDPGMMTVSLYWDRPDYNYSKSDFVKLPTAEKSEKELTKKILDTFSLNGKVNLKGVSFDLRADKAMVLGNIYPQDTSKLLSRPMPWTICMSEKETYQIDAVNNCHLLNGIVLFTRDFGKTNLVNQYGTDVSVRCGHTHYSGQWGIGNEYIPRNGYVISARGEPSYKEAQSILRRFKSSFEIKDADSKVIPLGFRDACGKEKESIKLNRNADSIVLLHTTAYEAASYMSDLVKVKINYTDGTGDSFDLRYGRDICSYDDVSFLYDKKELQRKWLAVCDFGESLHDGKLLYAYQWHNPNPEKKIANIDFVASDLGKRIGYILFGMSVISK